MRQRRFELSDGMLSGHVEKLKKWYNLLNDIMPDYFFNTFTAENIQDILPVLFNLKPDSGIQRIYRKNSLILIYFKNDQQNLVTTAEMVKKHDVEGACIHESKEKIVIDGEPATLVIEYYTLKGESSIQVAPLLSLQELKKSYKKLYKKVPQTVAEAYDRINWNVVADLDPDRLSNRLYHALEVQEEDHIILDVEKAGKNEIRLTMAVANCPSKGFYYKYIQCLHQNGFEVSRAYLRKMLLQDNVEDFQRMPVSVNTLYLKTEKKGLSINSPAIAQMLSDLPHIKWVSMDDMLHQELVIQKNWSLAKTNLIRSAAEFVHAQLSFVDRHAYNCQDIYRLLALYEPLLENFFKYFDARFNPDVKRNNQKEGRLERKIINEIEMINTGTHEKDVMIKTIFSCVLNFFNNIRKTNYYTSEKTALAFRVDPAFMSFYDENYANYKEAFPEDRPYGIFYFYRDSAIGFQVRFSNIARGGWRTVIPKERGHHLEQRDIYSFAKDEIFKEVFVLAHTQHLKNKDIYEGGSKMICLLDQQERDFFPFLYENQRSITRAFLQLINYNAQGKLKTAGVIDLLGENEIIEIGPDENMLDVMINWMSQYAEKVGYRLGGGVISGKPDSGINHKEYGVTSFGVHQYLLKTLEELEINSAKDEFTVKISGGPFGDVAGNELKLLFEKKGGKALFPNVKIVAVTDGPAAAYDPEGLDKAELQRLIHSHNLDAFATDKLKGEGAYIVFSEPIMKEGNEYYRYVQRAKGKLVEKMISRDEFMKLFQENLLVNYADVFIPCGGRPATINISNWQEYCPGGKPSSKAIVEGANSFVTPDARHKLQAAGVWIIKDASANKCGVITSSYEILSGLMLKKDEFKKMKKALVPEILDILKVRAQKEADWLFEQFKSTGLPMTDLTEQLSHEINAKNEEIYALLQDKPELLKKDVIFAHLPKVFSTLGEEVLAKVPVEYQEAIVAVELACRIIYGRTKSLEDEIKTVC